MKRLTIFALLAACGFAEASRKPGLYAVFDTSLGTITAQFFGLSG